MYAAIRPRAFFAKKLMNFGSPFLVSRKPRIEHPRLESVGVHNTPVFVGGEVHQGPVAVAFEFAVQGIGDFLSPERVEVRAPLVDDRRSHFQSVGMDPVERPQQPVQTGQDAHPALQGRQLPLGEIPCPEAHVDITGEGERRLLAAVRVPAAIRCSDCSSVRRAFWLMPIRSEMSPGASLTRSP